MVKASEGSDSLPPYMRIIDRRILDTFKRSRDSMYLNKRDRIVRFPMAIAYQLYGTSVAVRDLDSCTLALGTYDGRWQTNTTKSRINAFADEYGLPRICQRNFVWTWSDGVPYTGVRSFSLDRLTEPDYANMPI